MLPESYFETNHCAVVRNLLVINVLGLPVEITKMTWSLKGYTLSDTIAFLHATFEV